MIVFGDITLPSEVAPLPPEIALLVILVSLGLTYGLYRLCRFKALRRLRPYVLVVMFLLAGLTVVEFVFAISYEITKSWLTLGIFLITIIAATNYQWIRNATAGLALEFEDSLSVGDSIRVGELEGTIESFGVRAVRIRGLDGANHDVPNRKLIDESVSNLTSGRDAPCEITVLVPAGIPIDRARNLGRTTALLSPLASPNLEPEVFVETDEIGTSRPRLRIHAFAVKATHQDRYKSDVTRRLAKTFQERSPGKAGEEDRSAEFRP